MYVKIISARDRKDSKGRKLPSAINMPSNISEKAKKLWKQFWKDYKKYILKYEGDYDKEWGTAVAIFKNYCLKRNVYPFKKNPGESQSDIHGYMQARMDSIRGRVVKTSGVILRGLIRKGAIKRYNKEKLLSITYNRGKFYIITLITAQITDLNSVRPFLLQKGFKKQKVTILDNKSLYKKSVDNNYMIAIDIEERKTKRKTSYTLKIYNVVILTKQQALIVATPSEAGDDKKFNQKKVEKELRKLFQFLMKTTKVEASSISITTSSSYLDIIAHSIIKGKLDDDKILENVKGLSKLDKIYLKELFKEVDSLKTDEIFDKYDLKFFKSKSPALRKAIVQKIMSVLEERNVQKENIPFIYTSIMKDPSFPDRNIEESEDV